MSRLSHYIIMMSAAKHSRIFNLWTLYYVKTLLAQSYLIQVLVEKSAISSKLPFWISSLGISTAFMGNPCPCMRGLRGILEAPVAPKTNRRGNFPIFQDLSPGLSMDNRVPFCSKAVQLDKLAKKTGEKRFLRRIKVLSYGKVKADRDDGLLATS